MMEEVTIMLDDSISTTINEQPSGQLRWVPGMPSWFTGEPTNRLQQLWHITTYDAGRPVGIVKEWRDVPLVTDDA